MKTGPNAFVAGLNKLNVIDPQRIIQSTQAARLLFEENWQEADLNTYAVHIRDRSLTRQG